jgi:hypothetical protein
MSTISLVISIFCWTIIALSLTPVLWLFLLPYIKGWSRAERRATDLLREMLTPEQLRQLLWRGYLEIPSPTEPLRTYRVPRTKGYVQVLENGHAIMRLCLQPVEFLPDADIVVLHKLMIEANEEDYLQKANKYICHD